MTTSTLSKNILIIFFFVALFAANKLHAQGQKVSLLNSLSVNNNITTHKVELKIFPTSEIANLLVVVANETGKITFLDNQYHHKGNYLVEIDTQGYEKGQYRLLITADNDKEERTIIIK